MNDSRGFTLIEVIIVVAVIGIMVAIATPTVMSWLPNYRLKGAVRDLYGAAMKAKGEAVKRNMNCALTFNQVIGGVANAYIVYVDADADSEYDAGEVVITQVLQWPTQVFLDTAQGGGDGLSFLDNDDGNPTISFRPNAIPTDNGGGVANGSAFLTNANSQFRSVVINQAGSVRIN